MISPIYQIRNKSSIAFGQGANNESDKDKLYSEDTLLENNLKTRSLIEMDKFTKAFTIYPAKGLKGSKNSNFYEFLTMGTVPYLVGSATMIAIFNGANRHFQHFANSKASKIGGKMAMGVALYGILKELSKSLITYPVKWKTGIDTELPYAKVNYMLQEEPGTYNETSIEYHKVGESVDFPRWDQLYGNVSKGEKINFRYDKIAEKNGLGTDLNDSDQEVKPMYKEVLIKSKLAKSISSYLWAGVGVALAFQEPMEDYLKSATLNIFKPKKFFKQFGVLATSIAKSAKSLIQGDLTAVKPYEKHAGKAFVGLAALSTIGGLLNTLHITKKPKINNNVIDNKKESVVS